MKRSAVRAISRRAIAASSCADRGWAKTNGFSLPGFFSPRRRESAPGHAFKELLAKRIEEQPLEASECRLGIPEPAR